MKSIELLLQQLETATDLLSKFQLGYLYDKGELLTQDDIRALAGYQQAAAMEAQNHLEEKYKVFAIYNVGVMHFYGRGTAVNLQEALTWINRAAESGNANGLWMLGQMHEQGKGVIKNYNEALRYYALAAKQNLPAANFDLGRMYFEGVGTKKDYIIAKQHLQKAVDDGHVRAKCFLGHMYMNGHGDVKYDFQKAIEYYKDASLMLDAMGQYYYGLHFDKYHAKKIQELSDPYGHANYNSTKAEELRTLKEQKKELFISAGEQGFYDGQALLIAETHSKNKYYYCIRPLLSIYENILGNQKTTLEQKKVAFEEILAEHRAETITSISEFIRTKIWFTKAIEFGSKKAQEELTNLNKFVEEDIYSVAAIEKYLPDFFQEQYAAVLAEIDAVLEKNRLRYEREHSTIPYENIKSFLQILIKTDNFEEYQAWLCCIISEVADDIYQDGISHALKANNWNSIKTLLLLKITNLNIIIKELNMSPLELMIEQGDVEGVEQLLTKEDLDINFSNPLFKAVSEEQVDIVILLLSHPKIDVNASKEFGGPNPLWFAAKSGFTEIVQELLLHPKIHVDYQCSKLSEKELLFLKESGKCKMSAQEVAKCYTHQDIEMIIKEHKNLLTSRRSARRRQVQLRSADPDSVPLAAANSTEGSSVYFSFPVGVGGSRDGRGLTPTTAAPTSQTRVADIDDEVVEEIFPRAHPSI